jgi:hypothetical protein
MVRIWKAAEFALLHANPLMDAAEVAERTGRTAGAVEAVRWGVHEWHGAGNISALNHMMLGYLDSHRGQAVCSQCRATM